DIEEHARRRGREYLGIVQEAHDVDDRGRRPDTLEDFGTSETDGPRRAAQQAVPSFESEATHDVEEIPDVHRILDARGRAGSVSAHPGIEPIEKYDVPAELAKPEQVLEKHPRVASAARLLRQRSGDDDGLHRPAPTGATSARAARSCRIV